jgi:hypothetical protein
VKLLILPLLSALTLPTDIVTRNQQCCTSDEETKKIESLSKIPEKKLIQNPFPFPFPLTPPRSLPPPHADMAANMKTLTKKKVFFLPRLKSSRKFRFEGEVRNPSDR